MRLRDRYVRDGRVGRRRWVVKLMRNRAKQVEEKESDDKSEENENEGRRTVG